MKLIPIIESNILPSKNQDRIDHIIEGLKIWSKVTGTAIVFFPVGHVQGFLQIQAAVPDMKLVPGLKANVLIPPDKLDIKECWRKFGSEVWRVWDATGCKQMFIDMETSQQEYWAGRFVLNPVDYEGCVNYLPGGIQYIWHPAREGKTQESIDRIEILINAIRKYYPDTIFPTYQFARKENMGQGTYAESYRRDLEDDATWSMVYYMNTKSTWYFQDIRQAMRMQNVMLYPSYDMWVYAAEAAVQHLGWWWRFKRIIELFFGGQR